MDESILTTIVIALGYEPELHEFDRDLIPIINSFLMALEQLGIGQDGFQITGEDETWSDFCTDISRFAAVKTYVHLKTKLAWDPPASATVLGAMEKTVNELEWRLNVKQEQSQQ